MFFFDVNFFQFLFRWVLESFLSIWDMFFAKILNKIWTIFPGEPELIPVDRILKLIKIKRGKFQVNYYVNWVASHNLILAGDIELSLEPGSGIKAKIAKCNLCDKSVGTNRKRV